MYALSLICLLFAPVPELKQEKFIAVDRKDGRVVALKTAIVTYTKGDVSVDLVGAVHVGDRAYYATLNRQFANYDCLLYELVAQPGVKPERGKGGLMSIVAKLGLDLESQTERINYKKANFVHADLSPNEIAAEMAKRGETKLVLGLRVLADVLQQQNNAKINPLDAIELANADNPTAVKRFLARQLAEKATTLPSLEPILIHDRNQAALRVMDREITAGKKKLGIFYGAAHLPDFQERLLKAGFTRTRDTWLIAWDLGEDE